MDNLIITYLVVEELDKDLQRKVERVGLIQALNNSKKAPKWQLPEGSLWRNVLGLIRSKRDAKVSLSGVNMV